MSAPEKMTEVQTEYGATWVKLYHCDHCGLTRTYDAAVGWYAPDPIGNVLKDTDAFGFGGTYCSARCLGRAALLFCGERLTDAG